MMLESILAATVLMAGPDAVAAARMYRQAHGAEVLREFANFLAIPNVASDHDGIRRNARFIAEAFQRRGVRMAILEIDDAPPIVVGVLGPPDAPHTIGIYAHYDGQPVDTARWTTPPWSPSLFTAPIEAGGRRRMLPGAGVTIDPQWRLYARSAGDDKAPIMALLAALDAFRIGGIEPSQRVVLLFEGEEEAGSPHLGQYFDAYADRLAADVWLICDGPVHPSRRPQVVFGVRGITSCEITVYGADRYLHSGHYGNWAPNPALMLGRFLSTMKDEAGRVTIKGFYDDVTPLTARERAAVAAVPDSDADLRREYGLVESEGGGALLVERLLEPSLNVNGFVSGTVGPGARNVIPPSATASLDIRLVKGNDPDRMLDLVEAHLREQGYHVVSDEPDRETRLRHARIARVVRKGGYRAARTPLDGPEAQRVLAAVARAAGEDEVILMPTMGGSLPLYLFEEKLGSPTIIVPIANHDNGQHGPDENLRLANLWYGIDVMAALLTMETD